MSTHQGARGFLGWSVLLCGAILVTAAAVGEETIPADDGVDLLKEVISRVTANEQRLSLVKMDFRTDFTSEGKVPDYSHRHPLASGTRILKRHNEIQWAQDGVRQRFVHKRFDKRGLTNHAISVVDGETHRASHLPEMKRGMINDVSRYNRWMVNFAALLFYRPFYNPHEGSRLFSETLTVAEVLSDISVQEVDGRGMFVLDVRSGRLGCRRLFIDRERGLLVRSDVYLGNPASKDAELVQRMESTQVHQTESGAWVPIKGRTTTYGDGYKQFIDVRVDVNSISVDRADFPDSLFQLEFPEYTIVTDRTR